MSTIDLAIIGILKLKPMSPYDIKKIIETNAMNNWIKIGTPTVFQNIKKLAKKEYLTFTHQQHGEMPQKTIYSVTDKGEAYFMELMEYFSNVPGQIFCDTNGVLAGLHHLSKKDALRMINNIREKFSIYLKGIEFFMENLDRYDTAGKYIIKWYYKIYSASLELYDDLAEDYRTSKKLKYTNPNELLEDYGAEEIRKKIFIK